MKGMAGGSKVSKTQTKTSPGEGPDPGRQELSVWNRNFSGPGFRSNLFDDILYCICDRIGPLLMHPMTGTGYRS